MTRITIERKEELLTCLINGHAQYDDYGKDIVCAAVSSISQFAINTIMEYDNTAKLDIREGYLWFQVDMDKAFTSAIISSLIKHLLSLEEEYPNNIKLKI